ncbi:MAG: cysteine desulfurase [Candidatus Omnitrophica bacterium]|nr:cysteine desulfurase [Candidatus Omnitrophota bacterium]
MAPRMIYLDYNATSPLRPEARQRMLHLLEEAFGNASSLHQKGRQARAVVEEARARLLAALGDPRGQIVFTSGGTEADNLALKGVARANRQKGDHLIVSSVEHHAVLHAAQSLAEEGIRVTLLPVDHRGLVDLQFLQGAITPKTVLISVMHANNEVGAVQPIEAIGRIARERGVLFHTDGVQSFGKLPLDAREAGADLVSLSAHKIGGPKGVGALYLRQGLRIAPLIHGGPHEHSLRAGTENVAGIGGMQAALEAALDERRDGAAGRVEGLRNRLEEGLKERVPDLLVNGQGVPRLPGTLNASFRGCHGETLLMAFDLAGIAVSTGSACSSGSTEQSHVLAAMGLEASSIEGSIRFSLGWGTTGEEIGECLERIPPIVERVRRAAVSREG